MTRRQAIRRAIADFNAIHGPSACQRDLALGAVAIVALALNAVLLVAAIGGGHG